MTTREDKYFQDEFIARWASRSLSQKEEQEFEQWLKSRPQHTHYFDSVQNIWERSGTIEIPTLYTTEERWNILHEKLVHKRRNHLFFNNILLKWFAGVAAILLIVFLVSTQFQHRNTYIMAPAGTHKTHTLPNGSTVILNAGSTIRYNNHDWNHNRLISLTGEAYFKVTHGQKFTVKTGQIETSVLGTVFNIKETQNRILVSCVEGKVKVEDKLNRRSAVLEKGLEAVVFPDEQEITVHEFDPDFRTAWISGLFHFNNAPLNEVFSEIENQYNVSVACPREFENLHFTGQFSNNDLNDALLVVCLANGLNYKIQKDSSIIISK